VLLAVWRLKEDAYSLSVRDAIAERTGRRLSVSAIYLTLLRLDKKGLLSSRLGEPTAERGGKAKRYFKLRKAGLSAVTGARERMNRMWDGLEAQSNES